MSRHATPAELSHGRLVMMRAMAAVLACRDKPKYIRVSEADYPILKALAKRAHEECNGVVKFEGLTDGCFRFCELVFDTSPDVKPGDFEVVQ